MLEKELKDLSIEELSERLKSTRANRRLKPQPKKSTKKRKVSAKTAKVKIDIDSIPDDDLKGLI